MGLLRSDICSVHFISIGIGDPTSMKQEQNDTEITCKMYDQLVEILGISF